MEASAAVVEVIGVLVVEPDAAVAEVAEPVGAGLQRHGDRVTAVAAALQLVAAGLPVVEAADHADRTGFCGDGQAECHTDLVSEGPVTLNHDISPSVAECHLYIQINDLDGYRALPPTNICVLSGHSRNL